jgi:hypothetical protein
VSYDKDRYWQPPGLSAIQLQLNIALTRRANGDEKGAYDAFKDLALLTESIEIIEVCEKFEKETENMLARLSIRRGYTMHDDQTLRMNDLKYLKDRNYDFLKLIILQCAKHNITIKLPREVPKGGEPT